MTNKPAIKQMLESEGWLEVQTIIERHKQDLLTSNKDTVEEKRIAYQTLKDFENELINEINA